MTTTPSTPEEMRNLQEAIDEMGRGSVVSSRWTRVRLAGYVRALESENREMRQWIKDVSEAGVKWPGDEAKELLSSLSLNP
jgi:hypothetical protein